MTAFAIAAVIFTFVAVSLVAWPLLRSGDRPYPVSATLVALLIPAFVLISYLAVSNYDWLGRTVATPAASPTPPAMDEAVAALEAKLKANPDDEEGWILLGSTYLSLERAAEAGAAYQRALDLSHGKNAAARLGVAESRFIVDPSVLSGPTGDEFEAVLAEEPRNPKALWYGGLVSLARGDPATAATRWRALLTMSPPDRVREIIERQLADLDRAAAGGPGTVAASGAAKASGASKAGGPAAGDGIPVQISVADGVRGKVSATAPLFVFVRDAGAAGPPLAVIRRTAGELPLSLRISDADVMMPGRSMSSVKSAMLVARVANGGDPMAHPGDVYGESRWERGAGDGTVRIVIDKVVGP